MMKIKNAILGLLLATTLGTPAASAATMLAVCSEDISCLFQGTVAVDTTAGHFDSAYSRFALIMTAASAATPPANRLETNTYSAASGNFWASAQYYSGGSATTTAVVFAGFSDGGVSRLVLRGTGTNQQIKLTTRNAVGTQVDLATASGSICAAATRCKLDIHVVYAVAGSVDVYSNGVNILTYSGDVTTNSATTLDKFYVGGLQAGASVAWSELIASDTDTRSMRLLTCAPLAAGNTQNWTGAVGNINANSYSDATFNYTTTNNDLSQWTTGCTVPTLSAILDVQSWGRLAIGSSGPQNAQYDLRIGGTDNNSSNLTGLTTSFGNIKYDWGVNSPASGLPWTRTDLTSSFNFGVKSIP
jgi:hypothetical protein